jgi:hypothetical protein
MAVDYRRMHSGRNSCEFRIFKALSAIERSVKPLSLLVDAFVNTFGITRPSPEGEARAGRIIALMLGGVLVVLCIAAWLLRGAFAR